MAKTFKATWLGDGDPAAQSITEGGITFVKGEAVSVPEDLRFNAISWAERIRDNPAFSIGNDDGDVVVADEEAEKQALRDQLDGLGVKYRPNASLESLRGLLADNTHPSPQA
jgi:hypothetical protein